MEGTVRHHINACCGAPVSSWTVEKELGHGSRDMLEEVYGRLGTVRHCSEVVEYRVDRQGDAWVAKDEETVQENGASHVSAGGR